MKNVLNEEMKNYSAEERAFMHGFITALTTYGDMEYFDAVILGLEALKNSEVKND